MPLVSSLVTPVFRLAESKDTDVLLGLIERYFKYDEIFFNPIAVRKGLGLLLSDRSIGRAWLVFFGPTEKPVGYVIVTFGFDLEFGGMRATLTDLYLEPASRGGGIGTAALVLIEKTCQELGMGAIELLVETDNTEAQGLYRKAGFKRHTRYVMSKRLTSPA
jgi:diamine N-acetyltransferase